MAEQANLHVHVSGLIANARLQKGFATLKELYRAKQPNIDYQTWLHAEGGRRIPTTATLIEIGDILNIDRESLILAYCKDKFSDTLSHQILESFQFKKFVNLETLIEAKDHDRSQDHVLTAKQVKAIQEDIRLRLYLNYTYDQSSKTNFSRLANFFGVEKSEVKDIVEHLKSLGFVEVIGEEVKRIHPHITMPKTADLFDLRRKLLFKSLELNVKPDSNIANYHATLSEESYKQIMVYLDFIEANLIKLVKCDKDNTNTSRFQIAIVTNRIKEGIEHDRSQESLCQKRQHTT